MRRRELQRKDRIPGYFRSPGSSLRRGTEIEEALREKITKRKEADRTGGRGTAELNQNSHDQALFLGNEDQVRLRLHGAITVFECFSSY